MPLLLPTVMVRLVLKKEEKKEEKDEERVLVNLPDAQRLARMGLLRGVTTTAQNDSDEGCGLIDISEEYTVDLDALDDEQLTVLEATAKHY